MMAPPGAARYPNAHQALAAGRPSLKKSPASLPAPEAR